MQEKKSNPIKFRTSSIFVPPIAWDGEKAIYRFGGVFFFQLCSFRVFSVMPRLYRSKRAGKKIIWKELEKKTCLHDYLSLRLSIFRSFTSDRIDFNIRIFTCDFVVVVVLLHRFNFFVLCWLWPCAVANSNVSCILIHCFSLMLLDIVIVRLIQIEINMRFNEIRVCASCWHRPF